MTQINASARGARGATPRDDAGRAYLIISTILGLLALIGPILFSEVHSNLGLILDSNGVRAAALIASIALFVAHARRSSRLNIRLPRPPARNDEFDLFEALEQLRGRLDDSQGLAYTPEDAVAFVHRFAFPDRSRARVVEEVALGDGCLDRRGSVQYRGLESRKSGINFLPLLRFRKGHLVDVIHIEDASGRQLSTLANEDFLVLVGFCIRNLLLASVDQDKINLSSDSDRLMKQLAQVESLFLSCALRVVGPTKKPDLLAKLKKALEPLPTKPPAANLLCNFAVLAATDYAVTIVDDIDPETRNEYRLVRYIYKERLEEAAATGSYLRNEPPLGSSRVAKLKDELRNLLGVDPSWLAINASRSRRCSSYHLRVLAPLGYYVGDVCFWDAAKREAISKDRSKGAYLSDHAYFRCAQPKGQPFAHLYTRHFSSSSAAEPLLIVRFFERYPGSMSRAGILGIATTIVVWLLGVIASAEPGSDQSGNADLAALVVTLPIALWSIGGFLEKSSTFSSVSLAAQAITYSSLILSIAALVAFLSPARLLMMPDEAPATVLLVNDPFWIALLVMALVNSTVTCRLLVVRGWRYRREMRGEFDSSEPLDPIVIDLSEIEAGNMGFAG